MQFNVIRTVKAFQNIAQEWNTLLSLSASHVPFLRHEYLITWWDTLGGAEWSDGELYVVTARDKQGELCGLAPLFFSENLEGDPALMLLGSIQISDFLDVLSKREHLQSFLTGFLEHLDSPTAPPWKQLDWYNLLEDSPTLPQLRKVANRMGWKTTQTRMQPAPYIPLPDDWDTYLAGIKKKQRHEIRRKLRRAAGHFIPVNWRIVEDGNSLDAEIDSLFILMAQDASKEVFLTEVMRTQMRSLIHAAQRADWLQLAFLMVGGEKAAAYLNFDYDNRIWLYNSGLDYKFSELSPGWVLLSHLIQWAVDHRRDVFDFLRGDEDYKYRFGGVDRYVCRIQVQR
jgi:CelD/BcsL family acetyltransferase involved in cellulose biosynthesis